MEEPEVVDDSKEAVSSRQNSADIHINSEIVAAHTRPVHVQTRQKSRHWEVNTNVSLLTKKLFAIDTQLEGEKSVS